MQSNEDNRLTVAAQTALKLMRPFQVQPIYDKSGKEVTLSLLNYPARPGSLVLRDLGPGQGRGVAVKATGFFINRLAEFRREIQHALRIERRRKGRRVKK